jgi:hypothetical protein
VSDIAVICLTVVPGIYVLGLIALMRLEYRSIREPRHLRRWVRPAPPVRSEGPEFEVTYRVTPRRALTASQRQALEAQADAHAQMWDRHEITRGADQIPQDAQVRPAAVQPVPLRAVHHDQGRPVLVEQPAATWPRRAARPFLVRDEGPAVTRTALIQYVAAAVCLALVAIAWTVVDDWRVRMALSLVGAVIAFAAALQGQGDR